MAGPATKTIAIANGAGFWGDNLDAPYLLARDAAINVLTLEYLAELTMGILANLRDKDPGAGYVDDLPRLLERLGAILLMKPVLRIVTNAGGLNPLACARASARVLCGQGLGGIGIAAITGDDVLGEIPGWLEQGVDLAHSETGEPLTRAVASRLSAANVYLGAAAIADALGEGARIVITGRVADASLTVGPAADWFGWRWDDLDRLAGATAAGHLIECGAQVTGGLLHDWREVPDLADAGYPIAEIEASGACVITKRPGSGGKVDRGTVIEQMLYEVDDPACYHTPDVDLDFRNLVVEQVGPNRVRVAGALGRARPKKLKLSAVYRDGYMASGMLAVVGRDAEAKARAAGQFVLDRVRKAGFELAESLVECLGAGDVTRGVVRPSNPPFEVVLRVTVRDPQRQAVERFCRELAPLVTAGPPGIAGYASGRPSPRPAFAYWPALVPRTLVEPGVKVIHRTAHEWATSP